VRHPILHLEVLAADGTRASDHVVFCRLRDQSVRVEECCRCARCDAIEELPTPAVSCTPPNHPLEPSEDPRGETIVVGSILCKGTLVLSDEVPVRRALEVMRDADRRSVPVVDNRHVMVGLIHDAAFVRPLARVGAVGHAMSSPIAIDERTPVRMALKLLVANHLREATVVSKERVPLGIFRDVDGLRWITAARRSAEG